MQLPTLRNRVALSYIFDYVIVILFILGFSALDAAEPYHQHFSLNNLSLQYPYAVHDRVPAWLAAVISCGFPLVFIILWTLFIDGIFSHHKVPSIRRQMYGTGRRGRYTIKERLWEMNCGILGLGLSAAASICVTGALKNATGKPRPDVIARCQPRAGSHDAPVYGLVTSEICTGDRRILKDGFKSWPSGHSSIAFAGLGYLSIWVSGKLHVLDNRGEVWKTVLVLIPMVAASLIAVSRIMDARHHPFDVISSSLLGVFVAWLAYRQYFPSLSETWKKGRAHPVRSWATEAMAPPAAEGFIRSVAEEDGQAGYVTDPLSKTRITTGADLEAGPMERRRQYLEEQETLGSRRRQAHGYYYLLGPTGAVADSIGTYPQPMPAGAQSYPHQHEEESSAEETDAYEMAGREKPPPVPKHTETPYQSYRPQGRKDTQSPATTSSQDLEDRKWGIAHATSAITGGQEHAGSAPPASEGDRLRRIELKD